MSNSNVSKSVIDLQPWPISSRRWLMVALLSVAMILSYIDRTILTLMVDPIKHDLGLTDTQMSLLMGLAFALFYAGMGIPIGRLADHRNRCLIVAIGVAVWSLATMAGSLASGFTFLFIARLAVGAGEASLNPTALSLISDNFPRDQRSRPSALFLACGPIGGGLAYILGGLLVSAMAARGGMSLPMVGHLNAWKSVFVLVGLPGLILSLLFVALVREPIRREQWAKMGALEKPTLGQAIGYVARNRSVYLPLIGGPSLAMMVVYGIQVWAPAMFSRTYGWPSAQTGLALGLVVLIFTPAGTMAVAWATERSRALKGLRADFESLIFCTLVGGGSIVIGLMMPNPYLLLLFFAPGLGLLNGLVSLPPITIQLLAPNELRGQLSALFFLTLSFVGMAGGTLAAAAVNDFVFGAEGTLNLSLALIGALTLPLAIILLTFGRNSVSEVDDDTLH